ncbi:MAG: hydroxyacid dehydrogenase [Planctomycetes bacterium]|nr:hydroxyacid dehydrogenase [Planctomycetota bacterium]
MPKIIVSIPKSAREREIWPDARERIEALGEVIWNEEDRKLEGDEKSVFIRKANALITGWGDGGLTPENIDAAPDLQIIALVGSSVKHISPDHALEKGITIVNTASAIGDSVAEFALTTALVLLKDIAALNADLQQGKWRRAEPGRDLTGRTVGVIGAGAVGRKFIELLQPFHVKLLIHDPYLPDDEAAKLGGTKANLDTLLRESEVISVHAGRTDETTHMIGKQELDLLCYGTVLVNTARGGIFDEAVLIEKLRQGKVKAALDVFEKEPPPAGSPLFGLRNVVLTPHKAGHTEDTYRRIGLSIAKDLELFFKGKEPINRLTKEIVDRAT